MVRSFYTVSFRNNEKKYIRYDSFTCGFFFFLSIAYFYLNHFSGVDHIGEEFSIDHVAVAATDTASRMEYAHTERRHVSLP